MNRTLVIGAGPAGLLAAWIARQGGDAVRVLAAGIGSTHVMPGWLGVLSPANSAGEAWPQALGEFAAAHPDHPYSRAGLADLQGGLAALREVCAPAGITYVGDGETQLLLPTALGAVLPAAYAPKSFAAGHVGQPGPVLIAGPANWRDFYPSLCAGNLQRRGVAARPGSFELPEMHESKFDATAAGLARLLDRPEVRQHVAADLKPQLGDAARVGMPAIVGLERYREAWEHLQDLLGLPVFEIPTLPPSVPGMRLWAAFKNAFARAGVQLLLETPVAHGVVQGRRVTGVAVSGAARETIFEADKVILATGGLYGGGIVTDRRGQFCETVFDLPVRAPADAAWFGERLLQGDHPVHTVGIRTNGALQPVDEQGDVLLENVRVAGRLLAGYNPGLEGSTEGVWLATAHRAASL